VGKRQPAAHRPGTSGTDEPSNDEQTLIADLDLRSQPFEGPLPPEETRFNFFLIDTAWNEPVSKVVRKNFPLIGKHLPHASLFVLDADQSIEILRHVPEAIGHDPMILVYDRYAPNAVRPTNYKGFRLSLGLLRHPEQALARLQEFVRFIVVHRQSARLDREVRRELHREGFEGMIKILRESTTEIL
jgi:hypothetical protein